MNWIAIIVVGAVCLCVGGIIMAIICDRANRAESERLSRELHDNSLMYLSAVQSMEQQIDDKDREIQLKQRVLDSLNEEVSRLRRLNAQLKRKEVMDYGVQEN